MSRYASDNNNRHQKSSWQKIVLLVSAVVLIGFLGSVWLSGKSYSDESVINKYFKPSPSEWIVEMKDNMNATNPNFLKHQFLSAEKFTSEKKYSKAIDAYNVILENSQNPLYFLKTQERSRAEWNKILLLSANNKPGEALEKLNLIIESDVSSEAKKEAEELRDVYRSFGYGWAN